jgi:NADH dehydrogenase (ubiquinone) 1 alpha/beta subcomplex 1
MQRLVAARAAGSLRASVGAPAGAALRRAGAAPAAPRLAGARWFGGAHASTFLPVGEVQERVMTVLKGFDKVDAGKVSPKAHFINDLGLDSLDTVEVVMAIEEEFVIEIPDDMAEKLLTVEDAVKFVSQHPQAK